MAHPPDRPLPPSPPADPLAWVDGRIVAAATATVPLTDDGFLRGDAVFEAMLVRRGRTHARELHLARMARSAAAVQLPLPIERIRCAIEELLAAFGPRDGSVRVIVTRGGAVRGLIGPVSWPDTLHLAVVEMPWRSVLSGVKTLSYAANQWALRQARSRGADDALIVDDGRVHELPTGAIVLVRDGVCVTPDPQRLPILASVSVEVLREVVDIDPTTPDLEDLAVAEEAMVVSATRPCLPVRALTLPDGTVRPLPAPGGVTARLRHHLEDHLLATLDPAPGDPTPST
ncbi:MAG: hypothetical protein EA387_13685 [Nitriliruptor sp.]|nr:MAG: hypothetical protein EA387_13685 [Nitriliruptor sp.]